MYGQKRILFRRGDAGDLVSRLQTLCDEPERVRRCRAGAADHMLPL